MTTQTRKPVKPPRRVKPAAPARRRRSFLDIVLGMAAVLALLVLVAGVPVALISLFGLPVPHHLPKLSLLTHQLDAHTIIEVCAVVVWVAWLQLVWCVCAEVSAAIRNVGMPSRVPLAGGTQAVVHYLVSCALLLSSATALSPALVSHSAPVATAKVHPGRGEEGMGQARPGAGDRLTGRADVGMGSGRPGAGDRLASGADVGVGHARAGAEDRLSGRDQRAPSDAPPLDSAAAAGSATHGTLADRDAQNAPVLNGPPLNGAAPNSAVPSSPAPNGPIQDEAVQNGTVPNGSVQDALVQDGAGAAASEGSAQSLARPTLHVPAPRAAEANGPSVGGPSASGGSLAAGGQAGPQLGADAGPASAAPAEPAQAPAAPRPESISEFALSAHPLMENAGLVTAAHTEKIYVVRPPEGRFHESLWEIAENHLGDGRRYREIFDLNKDRPQPDGTKLTIASLIRPGWTLIMPHDAHGPGIEVVTVGPSAPANPSPANPAPQPKPHHHQQSGHGQQGQGAGQHGQGAGQATPGAAAPGHAHAPIGPGATGSVPGLPVPGHSAPGHTGPGHTAPGHTAPGHKAPHSAPGHTAPGHTAPGHPTPAPRHPAHPAPAHEGSAGFHISPYAELAGAVLLAAGVIAALGRRRRSLLWQRTFGQRLAVPAPDAALAETSMRMAEDADTAGMLDAGLRYLGQALLREERTPPTVFAAHIGTENIDLWVAPASPDAPTPWYAVGDGQVWRLPLAAVPGLRLLADTTAPYPGLVSIGTDATGRVLVDVASAHGLIAVTGPDEMVRDALAAMATELATSGWSDGIHLTLVGFGADLAVLAPGRVSLVPTLAEALPELETWATEVSDVFGGLGTESVHQARAEGLRTAAWEPHYLISAIPPTSNWERERLLALARTGQAAGGGYIVAGDIPGATWTWELTRGGRLRAGQLGLDVAAQVIPHEQQVALVDLFESAAELVSQPLAEPSLDAAPEEHLAPEAEVPVEVTLLGPVAVRAPGDAEPDRLAIATEIVVYLAIHPGGVHPNVLTAAIWPRGVTPEVRDATLDRVRAWLGTDGIGRPHLASDATGRLRLGSGVRIDWNVFCALVARAAQAAQPPAAPAGKGAAPAEPPEAAARRDEAEAGWLSQALDLVSGQFVAGRSRGRYAWLALDGLEWEVEARVADAAHRLWQLRRASHDAHGAMEAARAGLQLATYDELLWRDLLTAAHDTGDEQLLRSVVSEVCGRPSLDNSLPGMSPETEALIDELLPSWRWPAA